MSLNWSASKVHNLDELQDDGIEWSKTTYLCFELMRVGVQNITEKNVEDVWTRIEIMQKLEGPLLTWVGEPLPLTHEDIVRRVGYSTNVSNETFSKVLNRVYKQSLIENKKDYTKEKV
jgi:predicted translin family RNA/ssDNA-binding protein